MGARVLLERTLREDDDHSGQTVRRWFVDLDAGYLSINGSDPRDGGWAPVQIRAADFPQLVADVEKLLRVWQNG